MVLGHSCGGSVITEAVTADSGVAHPLAASGQPLTNAGRKAVPSTYVVCQRDQAIPVPAQEAMAQRAGEVLRMDTGHSSFLPQPEALAALLRPLLRSSGGALGNPA